MLTFPVPAASLNVDAETFDGIYSAVRESSAKWLKGKNMDGCGGWGYWPQDQTQAQWWALWNTSVGFWHPSYPDVIPLTSSCHRLHNKSPSELFLLWWLPRFQRLLYLFILVLITNRSLSFICWDLADSASQMLIQLWEILISGVLFLLTQHFPHDFPWEAVHMVFIFIPPEISQILFHRLLLSSGKCLKKEFNFLF